jgi:hypothetical protein
MSIFENGSELLLFLVEDLGVMEMVNQGVFPLNASILDLANLNYSKITLEELNFDHLLPW